MKKEFLKMAGVENEKDFYKLFPTEAAFFGMYPEAKKLVQKTYGGLIKAQEGKEYKGYSDEQLLEMMNNFQVARQTPIFGKPSVFNLNGENNHHGQVTNIFYSQKPFDDFLKRKELEKKATFKNGGQALPKAQFGLGKGKSSMVCTSKGCRVADDENAWVNNSWQQFISSEKPQPPATEWETLTSYLTEDERKNMSEDDQAAMAMHRRFQHMKNPKNQLVTSQGAYAGYPGASQTFYEKMNALPQNIYSGDPNSPTFREWLRQQTVNEENKPIDSLKNTINKDYYSNFTVPSKVPRYFKKGGLVKYQSRGEVVNIDVDPNDVELFKNENQKLLNYFTRRKNFQDPNNPERAAQIRHDAEEIESLLRNEPENYGSLIQYRTPKWFAGSGAVGRYEPNMKDPSKDKVVLYDPRIKSTDDYIKYYYPDNKKAQEYINQNRAMYDEFFKEGSEQYPRRHEFIHQRLQRSLIPILKREDNADLIYNALVGPKKFESLYQKRTAFKNPSGQENMVIPFTAEQKRGVRNQYGWMAGENQKYNIEGMGRGSNRKLQSQSDNIPFSAKDINPQEWAQARHQLFEQFNLDPAKPITAEDLKKINEESFKIYKDNYSNSPMPQDSEKYHVNEHIQDFFDVHGKDYEKMAELLNSVVKNKSRNTSQFARYGGGTSNKNFEKSQKFNNLLVSGVRKPNLFKAQFGLNNLNPFLGMDWMQRWLSTAQKQQENSPSALQIIFDPTGYSNYGNLLTAIEEIPKSKGILNTAKNVGMAALELAASLPMIGGAVAPIKGIKALRKLPLLEKSLVKGHNVLTKVQPIAGIDKRLYAPLYKTAASGLYRFASPVGRATRFGNGLIGGASELFTNSLNNESPKQEEFIKIKYPDGSVKTINVYSQEYADIYDSLDPNTYNLIDSTYSFKKKNK
jgi:hypothetical protein